MVDVTVFMLPAALSNATAGESLGGVALPATLAASSLAGLAAAAVAAVLAWRGRTVSSPGPAARGPAGLAAGAVLALAAVLGAVAVAGPREPAAAPGSQRIALRAARTAYSTTALTARPGQVTVSLTNRDLFWHTFTIERLGVNVDVPVGGTRSVSFTAEPGTWTFVCTIPGHAAAGMRGTLTVR
jgi:plastocyanin